MNNSGKSQFYTNFSAVFCPLSVRKCNNLLEKWFPKSCRALGETGVEQTHYTEGPGSSRPAPLPPYMSSSPVQQARIYWMDTCLCSTSNAPCHVELPKLRCHVEHTYMAYDGREVHHVYLCRAILGVYSKPTGCRRTRDITHIVQWLS